MGKRLTALAPSVRQVVVLELRLTASAAASFAAPSFKKRHQVARAWRIDHGCRWRDTVRCAQRPLAVNLLAVGIYDWFFFSSSEHVQSGLGVGSCLNGLLGRNFDHVVALR